MGTKTKLFLLFLVLVVVLGCQTVSGIFNPAADQDSSAQQFTPSAVITSTSSQALTPTAGITATSFPTHTATSIPTPTVYLTPSSIQLDVFEELWRTIDQEYLYADFNGLDWDAVHQEYLQKIQSGLNDEDFYLAMAEMVNRLGDEHSTFFSPEMAVAEDEEYEGAYDYVGIGIYSVIIPEKDRMTIILVFPGSPADSAGLKNRDSILEVDGIPILDENGFHSDLIRGPEDTELTLTVQTPGEEPRQVTLTRQRILGNLPIPHQRLMTSNGNEVGYLLLPTFTDGNVDELVQATLEELNNDRKLQGLIIDNRMNSGGVNTEFIGVLRFFTNGKLGHFVNRDETRLLRSKGVNVKGSQEIPLVVLIGPDTASFGEIFAGILQDTGRAHLIGQTTAGNVEILWIYEFQDGSRAWIAHESFRPLNHPDQDWEQTGIIPDLEIPGRWDEFTFDTDPVIQAALEYLDQNR